MWVGLTIGLLVVAVGETVFVTRIDWKRASLTAALRSEKNVELENFMEGEEGEEEAPKIDTSP